MKIVLCVLVLGLSGCATSNPFVPIPCDADNCGKATVRFYRRPDGQLMACGTSGVHNPCWEVHSDLEGKI